MSKKATNDALREMYVNNLIETLTAAGEDVLRVGSNEIAIPVIDGEGEDSYVVFVVKVPTGSRDGEAYGLAQEYEMKQAEKKEKAEKAAKEKAAKIARDQKMREQKRAAREAHIKE